MARQIDGEVYDLSSGEAVPSCGAGDFFRVHVPSTRRPKPPDPSHRTTTPRPSDFPPRARSRMSSATTMSAPATSSRPRSHDNPVSPTQTVQHRAPMSLSTFDLSEGLPVSSPVTPGFSDVFLFSGATSKPQPPPEDFTRKKPGVPKRAGSARPPSSPNTSMSFNSADSWTISVSDNTQQHGAPSQPQQTQRSHPVPPLPLKDSARPSPQQPPAPPFALTPRAVTPKVEISSRSRVGLLVPVPRLEESEQEAAQQQSAAAPVRDKQAEGMENGHKISPERVHPQTSFLDSSNDSDTLFKASPVAQQQFALEAFLDDSLDNAPPQTRPQLPISDSRPADISDFPRQQQQPQKQTLHEQLQQIQQRQQLHTPASVQGKSWPGQQTPVSQQQKREKRLLELEHREKQRQEQNKRDQLLREERARVEEQQQRELQLLEQQKKEQELRDQQQREQQRLREQQLRERQQVHIPAVAAIASQVASANAAAQAAAQAAAAVKQQTAQPPRTPTSGRVGFVQRLRYHEHREHLLVDDDHSRSPRSPSDITETAPSALPTDSSATLTRTPNSGLPERPAPKLTIDQGHQRAQSQKSSRDDLETPSRHVGDAGHQKVIDHSRNGDRDSYQQHLQSLIPQQQPRMQELAQPAARPEIPATPQSKTPSGRAPSARPYTAGTARLFYALRSPVPVRTPVAKPPPSPAPTPAPALVQTAPAPPTTPWRTPQPSSPRIVRTRNTQEPQQTRYGTPSVSHMIAAYRVPVPAVDYEHGPSLLTSPREAMQKPTIPDRSATATPNTVPLGNAWGSDVEMNGSFHSASNYNLYDNADNWQRDEDEISSIHSNARSLYGSISRASTPYGRPYVQSVASERVMLAEYESTIASGRSSRVSVPVPQLTSRTRVKLPGADVM